MHKINEFAPSADRHFVLGCPTGGTPVPVYKKLVEFHKVLKVLNTLFAWWELTLNTLALCFTAIVYHAMYIYACTPHLQPQAHTHTRERARGRGWGVNTFTAFFFLVFFFFSHNLPQPPHTQPQHTSTLALMMSSARLVF